MSTASPSPVDTPARPRTAVIAGGGIAGLASAIALGRAGWDVTVLERAESIGERGSGLALWPGGTAALETLALGPSVADVSHLGETGGFRACDGRLLAQVDPDRFRDRFGPTTAIARGDLLELLHHGAQWAGARIVTGARVRRAGASGAVGWETGGREESALVDLVVGADGIGSAVRRAVLPTAAGPQSTGLVAWRWVVDLDAVEEPLTGPDGEPWVPAQCSTLGRGMEFGIIPLPGGRVYCYASSAPTGDGPVPGPEAYLTWHDPIPALVRAGLAASSPMDRRELADLPALSTFAVGRVLLVGDAAHAMTPHLGQGACQALEDAAALARCAQRISDPAQLARAVDAERRPRTQRFQAGSRRAMGAMAMGSPLLCGLRDGLLAALPDALVTEAIGRNAQ